MTNYNERLDDVLTELRSGTINFDDKAKQAITSLIKELVAEAKPEQQKIENMGDTNIVTGKQIGRASCRERVSAPV